MLQTYNEVVPLSEADMAQLNFEASDFDESEQKIIIIEAISYEL